MGDYSDYSDTDESPDNNKPFNFAGEEGEREEKQIVKIIKYRPLEEDRIIVNVRHTTFTQTCAIYDAVSDSGTYPLTSHEGIALSIALNKLNNNEILHLNDKEFEKYCEIRKACCLANGWDYRKPLRTIGEFIEEHLTLLKIQAECSRIPTSNEIDKIIIDAFKKQK